MPNSIQDDKPLLQILMLGGPGSGKTCMFLGMYEDMRYGQAGFTFSALDGDQDLELSEAWEKIENEARQGNGRFPLRSDEYTRYSLSLNYALDRFMRFDWVDYPGGALYGKHGMNADLKTYLDDTESVLICLPADHLLDYLLHGRNALKSMSMAEIQRLVEDLRVRFAKADRPTVIVVATKYDLFARRVSEGRDRQHWDRVLGGRFGTLKVDPDREDSPLRPMKEEDYQLLLMEAIVVDAFGSVFAPGGEWNTMIVPVTLGMELATDVTAEVDMVNTHLPVLLTFVEYAQRIRDGWLAQEARHDATLDDYSSKNRFMRWFYSEEISDARARSRAAKAHIDAVTARLNVVRNSLPDDIPIYRNGVRVSGTSTGE